jgi:hypothetical protein
MPYGIGTIVMIGGGLIASGGLIPIVLDFGTTGIATGSAATAI